jgi:predicted protein tyrosine phosphatase
MKIYVSSLNEAHKSVVAYQPQSIISFVDTLSQKPYFLNYDSDKHLVLSFNDVHIAHDDTSCKQRIITAQLIEFLTKHDMRYPLLIHCTLGISRSTAVAYIALNLHHKNQELQTAHYLRSKMPYAVPNITLVSLADSLLGAGGRMIDAIESLPAPNMKEAGGCKMISTDFD